MLQRGISLDWILPTRGQYDQHLENCKRETLWALYLDCSVSLSLAFQTCKYMVVSSEYCNSYISVFHCLVIENVQSSFSCMLNTFLISYMTLLKA